MSKTGVNTGFAKCFILFMALFIMLQGFIYLALSLWGLVLTNCSNQNQELYDEGKISANPFRFIMDLIYLKQEDCGAWNVVINQEAYPLTINWDESRDITFRERIFFIVYIVISSLWILSSLLVIATLCGRLTLWVTALCFWPWFLFVLAGSVLDVVATVYHVLDITHTTDTDSFLNYIGINTIIPAVETVLQGYDTYFIVPAVVMTCISSRVVLVWILNLFGSMFCITMVQAISNNRRRKQVQSKNVNLEPYPVDEQPTRPISTIGTASVHSVPQAAFMETETVISKVPEQTQSTYRNTDAHPGRLNYPRQTSGNGTAPPLALQHQLSVVSPLNNRYSSMENMPPPQTPVRVSAELRSQLPWSYTNANQQGGQPRGMYPEVSRTTSNTATGH